MSGVSPSQPTTGHTPTPWKIYADSDPLHIAIKGYYSGFGAVHVADVLLPANAAFIVEAVNSHAGLKEQIAWWEEQARQQAARIQELEAKVARYEACQSKVDCLSRGDFPKVKP